MRFILWRNNNSIFILFLHATYAKRVSILGVKIIYSVQDPVSEKHEIVQKIIMPTTHCQLYEQEVSLQKIAAFLQ
jgi:hypothetical protein